jgi:RNA polymerase sigma-70 factor, ECF subfamily
LFTIARHTMIDWQRRRARRPLVQLDHQQPSDAPLLEVQFEETELQSHLRRLIQALEADEQELIALKFGAGMTNREIAQVLAKSETAIGSSIYRVMQKLRAQWGNKRP